MLTDRYFNLPCTAHVIPNDPQTIHGIMQWHLNISMQQDVCYVLFTSRFKKVNEKNQGDGIMGIAYYPGYSLWPFNEPFVFIKPGEAIEYRVLAHEFGHIMSKLGDVPNPEYIFFPKKKIKNLDMMPQWMRRVSQQTVDDCRNNSPEYVR